jgi:exosortase F-associated protein
MPIQSFQKLLKLPDAGKRSMLLLIAIGGLVFVYLNQQFNYSGLIGEGFSEETKFVVNKTVRYLLNDNFCLLAIYALFMKRSYVIAGVYIEVAGLFILLPLYFALKLYFEGTTELSSPLLSFYHRLIINPTLMIILILGMIYQQRTTHQENTS